MTPLWSEEIEARVRAQAQNLDEQDQPTEVRFCKKCVVSNQRPRIVFDDEGVCSACRYAERKKHNIDWEQREWALHHLLAKHRKKSGYDVIVPVSGGKDSAMIAHRLKHEYDMNPLCVKWAPFAYTDIGRKNFEAFNHAGFDILVGYPDGLNHRRLARLAFEFLGDAWQPFAFGQLCYPMHMAAVHGVNLVMFGENGEAEYGGDPAADDKPCWDTSDWERVYLKGAGVQRLVDLGKMLGAIEGPVSPFYGLPKTDKPEFHWFGYYQRWHPQANYYYAVENTGFEANGERSEGTYSKYASLDDRLDGFHYFLGYIKFGIGRCTSDAAHEIRDGEIDREEGVALVKRYDGEFPTRYQQEFIDYIGVDAEQFFDVVDRYRPPHLWRGNPDDGWELKHAVWHE